MHPKISILRSGEKEGEGAVNIVPCVAAVRTTIDRRFHTTSISITSVVHGPGRQCLHGKGKPFAIRKCSHRPAGVSEGVVRAMARLVHQEWRYGRSGLVDGYAQLLSKARWSLEDIIARGSSSWGGHRGAVLPVASVAADMLGEPYALRSAVYTPVDI